MNPAEALNRLPRIHFQEVSIKKGYGPSGRVEHVLRITASVDNRETGYPTEIGNSKILTHWDAMDPKVRTALLRSHMLNLCAHEIDEMFFVAGLGPDPHAV